MRYKNFEGAGLQEMVGVRQEGLKIRAVISDRE